MMSKMGFVLAGCILMLVSCNTTPRAAKSIVVAEYIVVRHAEKSTDDVRDPSLSEAGNLRAQSLARLLTDVPVDAVYATSYKRTQQTAKPSATSRGLAIITYDATLPTATFVAQLRAVHAEGTVLVVGHSNTVPEIVCALSGKQVEPMPDTAFDRLYRVTFDARGVATLVQARY